MINCPNCNKELEDGAKFCSQCGCAIPEEAPAPAKAAAEQDAPSMEIAEAPLPAPEKDASEEKQASPDEKASAAPPKRSKKGVWMSMLVAILAVVCMYVFYGELGFDAPKGKTNNAIVYVKEGQLWYNDLGGSELQLTKDLAGAVAEAEYDRLADLVKISPDGKMVFYPDRNGSDGGVSLYSVTVGKDSLPVKLGNDIVQYRLLDDGASVLYLSADGSLYRHDGQSKTKVKAGVTGFYGTDGLAYAYLTTESGLYYYDGTSAQKIAGEKASTIGYGGGTLIYREEDSTFVVMADRRGQWDLSPDVTEVRPDEEGSTLYYTEEIGGGLYDLYCVTVKDGKMGAPRLWEGDIQSYLVCGNTALCVKDGSDLYVNGVCLGYDVSDTSIAASGGKIAFLADCDAVGGSLCLWEGKKSSALRDDVRMLGFTAKGELYYLCDVGKTSGKGSLYLHGTKPTLIAEDVSFVIVN